jgi:toxin ParE1/3/4
MHLRWTEAAAADLERKADDLLSHAPDRASRLVQSTYDAGETLLSFPHRGRPGKKAGTREPVLSPLPWIVVYTVRDDVVHVVRHPARSATMALANDTRRDGVARTVSGQWRAMPDGIDGIPGNGGNVVSVTYRF